MALPFHIVMEDLATDPSTTLYSAVYDACRFQSALLRITDYILSDPHIHTCIHVCVHMHIMKIYHPESGAWCCTWQ